MRYTNLTSSRSWVTQLPKPAVYHISIQYLLMTFARLYGKPAMEGNQGRGHIRREEMYPLSLGERTGL